MANSSFTKGTIETPVTPENGGTGLSSLGTAGQTQVVNEAGTAMEWGQAGNEGVSSPTANTFAKLTCGTAGSLATFQAVDDAEFSIQVDGKDYDVDSMPIDREFVGVKHESGTGYDNCRQNAQKAQIFNTGGMTQINSIWIKGKPEQDTSSINIVLELFEVDGNNHPTGSALRTKTVNSESISDNYLNHFYPFNFADIEVSPNTNYAVVVRTDSTSSSYEYRWVRSTDGSFGYPSFVSTDGTTWTDNTTDYEYNIEIHGEGNAPLGYSGVNYLEGYALKNGAGTSTSFSSSWFDFTTGKTSDGNPVTEIYIWVSGLSAVGTLELAIRDGSNNVVGGTYTLDASTISSSYSWIGGVLSSPATIDSGETLKVSARMSPYTSGSIRVQGSSGNGGYRMFSLVNKPTSNDDLAEITQGAIRVATGRTETVEYDTDHVVITTSISGTGGSVGYLSALSGGSGTDVSGSSYLNGQTGTGVQTAGTSDSGKVSLLGSDGGIKPSFIDGASSPVTATAGKLIGGQSPSATTVFDTLASGDDDGAVKVTIDGTEYDNLELSSRAYAAASQQASKESYYSDVSSTLSGDNKHGQTFVAPAGMYRLTSFELRSYTPSSGSGFNFKLKEATRPNLGTTISDTYSASWANNNSWQTFTFTEPVPVTPGTTYTIVMYWDSGAPRIGYTNGTNATFPSNFWMNNSGWGGPLMIRINGSGLKNATVNDLASSFQSGIRSRTGGNETVEYSGGKYIITSGITGSTSAVSALSTPTTGTDLSGAGATAYIDAASNAVAIAGTGNNGKPALTNSDGIVDSRIVIEQMTTTARDAVSSPYAGQVIYNTTTNKLNFYNGSSWEAVTSA